MDKVKECKNCHVVKPLTDFNKCSGLKDFRRNECRACQVKRAQAYTAYQKTEEAAIKREQWIKDHPTKRCSKCGEIKLRAEFSKSVGRKDGLACSCKACHVKQSRAYYLTHTGERRESSREWAKTNPRLAWALSTRGSHRRRGMVVLVTSNELADHAATVTECPICGRVLDWSKGEKKGVQPNSPTWDRKYNGDRLTLQNTWIICHRCNAMKQDVPLPELVEWCRTVIDKFGSVQ